MPFWPGSAPDRIRDIRPAADIVRSVVSEAEAILNRQTLR